MIEEKLVTPPIRAALMEENGRDAKTPSRDWWLYWNALALRANQNAAEIDQLEARAAELDSAVDAFDEEMAGLLRSGTHAARVAAAPDPLGAVWVETDRNNIVYQAQRVAGGALAWVYVTGAMSGTVIAADQRPAGLGVNDTGLLFFSTDSVSVRWDGASWKQLGRIIDTGDFATNPRSQTVWKALGAGAVSVHCVGSGNENIAFGAEYDSGWKARDTAVAVLEHQGNALNFYYSAGNTIGATPALPTRISIDLATGHITMWGLADANLGILEIRALANNNAGVALICAGAAGMKNWQITSNYFSAGDLAFIMSADPTGPPASQCALDLLTNGGIRMPLLPGVNPGAGTKQLWYDPADANRLKYSP